MQFHQRSNKKEILDNEVIETSELNINLKELNFINKNLGGYNATLKGLNQIFEHDVSRAINILDIGFGGGDSIRVMADFAAAKNRKVFFYGVDLKADCVNYASQNLSGLENKMLICDDYRNLSSQFLDKIDVIHCSLFIHHLNDLEITELFKFSRVNNCILLINDLHRNPFAYYSIKILTGLFSKSRLVKNDAPLSVLRGFKKNELVGLSKKAGFTEFSISWTWAFRYLLLAKR